MPQPTERLATRERLGPTRHRAMVRKTQSQSERRETAATECLVDGPVPRTENSFLIRRPGCQRFPTPMTPLGALLTHHVAHTPPHVQPFPAGTVLEYWGQTPRPQLPFQIMASVPPDSHLLISELLPKHPAAHHFAAKKWAAGGTDVLESRRRVGETTEAPQDPRRSPPCALGHPHLLESPRH